jgi:hypothetical protein
LPEHPKLFDLLGGDPWTIYPFLIQPKFRRSEFALGPKPVFRINSNYLFGVEPAAIWLGSTSPRAGRRYRTIGIAVG